MNFWRVGGKVKRKLNFVAGSWLVLLALMLSENKVASAQAETTLTVSPASGPPGTSVTAKGTGFPPNISLNIGIGPPNSEFGGSYAQMVADANGTFEITFRLERTPDNQNLLQPGRVIIAAHDQSYMFTALAEFRILPGGGAPSGDSSGAMPENMPSAGFGGVKSASGNPNLLILFTVTTVFSAAGLYLGRRKRNTAPNC
jgi:hypothetical protein